MLRLRYMLALISFHRQEWPRELPPTPWSGDSQHGYSILGGSFVFHGNERVVSDSFWQELSHADVHWLRNFYDFHWLADLVAADDSEKSAALVRSLIIDWIDSDNYLSPVSRHADIVGERVANWFVYQDFLLKGADDYFKRLWIKHQYRGVLQLEKVRRRKRDKTSFAVLKGLLYSALALPSAAFLTHFTMRSLLQALQ